MGSSAVASRGAYQKSASVGQRAIMLEPTIAAIASDAPSVISFKLGSTRGISRCRLNISAPPIKSSSRAGCSARSAP